MRNLIESTMDATRQWHEEGRRYMFFDSAIVPTTEPFKWFVELAYHDYCGWHLIEEFPATAMESMRVNRSRCEVMDRIDAWFMGGRVANTYMLTKQGVKVVPNTETFGSLLDRIINHQIKLLHMPLTESLFTGMKTLEQQLAWLIDAAVQLDEDCAAGRRYCFPFTRTKVGLPI